MTEKTIRFAHAAMDRADWHEALRLWRGLGVEDPVAFWPKYWEANMLVALGDRAGGRQMLEKLLANPAYDERFTLLSRLTELALEDRDVSAGRKTFDEVKAMPQSTPESVERLASWIIRLQLESNGFPPSIFELDRDLLDLMPA